MDNTMNPSEMLQLVDKASAFLRDQKELASAGKVGPTGEELIALMRAKFAPLAEGEDAQAPTEERNSA